MKRKTKLLWTLMVVLVLINLWCLTGLKGFTLVEETTMMGIISMFLLGILYVGWLLLNLGKDSTAKNDYED
ncbi:hypothetical protein ACFL0Z_01335 [Patescibacteria group bacterium]